MKKKRVKAEMPAVEKYEDYVAIKRREQEETAAMEVMMQNMGYPGQDDSDIVMGLDPYLPEELPVKKLISELANVKALHGAKKKASRSPRTQQMSGIVRTHQMGSSSEGVAGLTKLEPTKIRITGYDDEVVYPSKSEGLPTPVRGSIYAKAFGVNRGRNFIEPTGRTEMEDEGDLLPELEASDAQLPADIEKFDIIRSALKIYRVPERTLIYAMAVDKQGDDNVIAALRCFGGIAYGGYARDAAQDSYLVECVESIHLATVPFSLRLEMPNMDSWSVEIPIPEKVLEKAFTPNQRKMLEDLRERFPSERYEIHYLQMLLSN